MDSNCDGETMLIVHGWWFHWHKEIPWFYSKLKDGTQCKELLLNLWSQRFSEHEQHIYHM
jgi:hypothetical protein